MGACSSTPSAAVVANASGPAKADNPAGGGILQTKIDGAPDKGGKGVTFAGECNYIIANAGWREF